MQIILCDLNREIVDQWKRCFSDTPNVRIFCGDFRELPRVYEDECFMMTSAGNSYGIMGGGLDLAIAKWAPGIEEHIRHTIEDRANGELLVGNGIVVPLEPKLYPFIGLIYTPTMISPMVLKDGSTVYMATKAALEGFSALQKINNLSTYNVTLILPGFGGRCGGLPPYLVARCMKFAYKRFVEARMPANEIEMYNSSREFYEICHR